MADSLSIALGISGPIDIPLLEPRSRDFSSGDFSGASIPLPPTQLASPGRTRSADQRTIDRPFTRTFDPTVSRGDTRRKRTLLLGAIGLALSAAILVVSIKSRRSTSRAPEAAVLAAASEARHTTAAQVAQPLAPDMSAPKEDVPPVEATPNPGALRPPGRNGVATVAPGTAASAPAAPLPPRRKAAKGAGGTSSSKHDYGI